MNNKLSAQKHSLQLVSKIKPVGDYKIYAPLLYVLETKQFFLDPTTFG